ncbi:MAG: hypothetical protein O3B24_05765 [Verrucomicrobia bacterium]|nr:hypothetical protein [Verrucomicrobiota bacterium]
MNDDITIANFHKALRQDQIDFFAANGYLSLGKVLDLCRRCTTRSRTPQIANAAPTSFIT